MNQKKDRKLKIKMNKFSWVENEIVQLVYICLSFLIKKDIHTFIIFIIIFIIIIIHHRYTLTVHVSLQARHWIDGAELNWIEFKTRRRRKVVFFLILRACAHINIFLSFSPCLSLFHCMCMYIVYVSGVCIFSSLIKLRSIYCWFLVNHHHKRIIIIMHVNANFSITIFSGSQLLSRQNMNFSLQGLLVHI